MSNTDIQYADELFPETKQEQSFADDLFPTSVDASNARQKLGGGPLQDFLFSNEKFSVARVLNHFGYGFKEGWGDKTGLSEDSTKKLREAGWFNDYEKGQRDLSKAAVESLFHAGAVVFQTLSGTMKGVGEVVSKDAQDAFWSVGGVPSGFYQNDKALGRDLAAMVTEAFPHVRPVRGTVGLPTLDMAKPQWESLLVQARQAKVIGHGEEGWRSGVSMETIPYDVEAAARTAEGFAPERVAVAGKPIDEQRAFIQGDVREKLIAAGRPEAEADAAAAIDAAYWETRAARFGGAKGTAEEMYRAEAPEIVAGKAKAEADAVTYAQETKSPEFQKWFGGSKVVDEDGKPLVVYKAMYPYDWAQAVGGKRGPEIESINRASEFPAFNKGEPGVQIAGFFGSKETANRFAEVLGDQQAIYPVYLKFEKPFVIDAMGEKAGNIQFGETGRPFRDAIRSGDYDGVIIKNTADEGDVYVALKPEQIKSVYNRGTFDPSDPNILHQGGDIKRGRIRIREEGRNTITLLKDANASTFIHEKGHDYLARLIKDADDTLAPEQLKADGATVLNWLGVKKADDIKTSHHEKFARGFENYIMEGKAPSQALARVFEQFRQWLLRIYTEAARLKAPINDDIRAVFDRMFALEPEQVKITPERAEALRAEAAAEVAPPAAAGAEASTVRATRDNMSGRLSPELQNARLAEARTGTEGYPAGSAESAGPVNAPEPVRGGTGIAEESGAVGTGGSAPAREALTVADKPAGEVAPHDSFGPHTDVADKAGNIRLDLLNAPDDVKRVISQIAEENDGFRQVRGPVSDVQVAELAEAMGMDAAYISTRKMGEAWTAPQIVALRNLLIQSADNVRDLMKKAATGDEAALQAYAEAKTRHMMIQERVSSVTSEAGRALRAFRKNFSAGMEEAASLGEFLKKETGQTLYQLQREAQLGASLETPAQVSKFINDTRRATASEMVQEAWINSLLSGPITHVKNIIGNTTTAVLGTAETAITAGVGKLRELAGNKGERVTIREAQANLFGLIQGAQDGLRAAKYAFLHEEQYTRAQTIEQAKFQAIPSKRVVLKTYDEGSPEFNKRIDSIANARARAERLTGDALEKKVAELKTNPTSDMVAEAREKAVEIGGKQIRTPGRLLTAEDEFFKTVAYRQKLNELAYREATKEGLSGDAFNQRIAQLTTYPPEEMMAAASKHADYQTFTNALGQTGRAIQNFSNSHIMAKMVVPFVRTPLNILKYANERTPLGVFSREVRANLSGVNGKIAQDQQIARMAMGTSMAIATMYLADQGFITGGGPSDRNEKAALMLSGWRPYSIKIGEHYYSYGWLEPFSTIMGISGDIAETGKRLGDADDDEMGKIAANLFASISKNVLSKSSLRGASDIMNAATDPDRFGDRYIQNLAGTVVPASVAQQARNLDDHQREIRSVLDAIKSRLPGLRTTLFPKRDVWGEPIDAGEALGPDVISPIAIGKLTKDPATQALLDADFFPAKLTRKIRGVELTDRQYDDFARTAGRMAKMRVDAIVSNPGFQGTPNEIRSEMLKKAINTSREAARAIMMMQNPDIIKQAMDNKLSAVGR